MASGSAWGGRFAKDTAPLAQRFGASVTFDWRLYRFDIAGSIAHSRMLAKQGIVGEAIQREIEAGLRRVLHEIEAGEFEWSVEREDVHLNVEAGLGDAGRALHTARSRNDQVALDVRLFARQAIVDLSGAILQLQGALLHQAKSYVDVLLPGYTHLQRAQPVLAAHYFLAYVEKYQRDRDRLADCRKRVNV
ncbi:MAG TPA: lyase family protein, partial [Chloroflexota bacterium]